MEHYIYMIANEVNDLLYIGSCNKTITIRFSAHKYEADNRPSNQLHYDMAKYGADKYAVFLLDTTDNKEDARRLEAKYMIQYDSVRNGYNKEYAIDKMEVLNMALDMIV